VTDRLHSVDIQFIPVYSSVATGGRGGWEVRTPLPPFVANAMSYFVTYIRMLQN